MGERKNGWNMEWMDLGIGVTMVLCLLMCYGANRAGIRLEALAVTTGAIMCVQDSARAAYRTSLTRILGVFCGGGVGVVIALIDNALGSPLAFYLLCGAGVAANLLVCRALGMVHVQARVSCLSLLLVALVQDTDRLGYALERFAGTLTGALIALLVSVVFAAVFPKTGKDNP